MKGSIASVVPVAACAGCAGLMTELEELRAQLRRAPLALARQALAAEGLCTRCGEDPAAPARRLCGGCLAEARVDAGARFKGRRQRQRCQDCGAAVEVRADGRPYSRCARHRAAATKRTQKWRNRRGEAAAEERAAR